ncbi:GNAT family N-acetyltransferase [Paenibacillus sacheonensis]|uniref:GNAT family N-acetyltransferase n=1 Tax=Paenibacillus sacheonensis TaxID=742054 RepID=A0A7X4YSE3_9BACL|nr:GNAT family N-acetyltransferase [Paenibacillus sacheonensis]MBM7566749.1 GNAT superfamily N-acetyltransferase [Paenibacillus sacheonensis]NBC71675.1 GNAT family N-acetyltransferase [Paenibacillus sacheonensis]
MTIIIRDATDADRDAVIQVSIDAYSQYSETLSADRWEAYRDSILASFDNEGVAAKIVAEEDGRIVGSAQLFMDSAAAYGAPQLGITNPIIRLLAVPPAHRGKGIATALIREAVSRSVLLGAEWLNLHTSDMMASAVSLYERLGFERAFNTDIMNGETLVKGYRLDLKRQTALL